MKSEINSLVSRISAGEDTSFVELCEEYDPLIRSMARRYAHMSGSADEEQVREDFSQEATFALYRAAQTYEQRGGEVSFGLYAKICIRNALVSELRRMGRKKKADKEQEKGVRFGGQNRAVFPVDFAINSLADGDILSPFEKKVFDMYVSGAKVRDMAKTLGRSSKSVSNAVYRIKSKLRLSLGGDSD